MPRLPVLLLMALAAAGCHRRDPITRYKAPKEPTWRMLAALVPAKDETWFFKSTGPAKRLAGHKDEFLRFLGTVKFEGGGPSWTLPAGWKEEKGGAERFATLKFGSPPLDLSISRLPGAAGGPLANINRWRGQLGLGAIDESTMAAQTVNLEVGGLKSVVVDLEGPQKPQMAPFAGGGGAMAAAPRGGDAKPSLRDLFDFELPPGWVENPHPKEGRYFEIAAGPASVYLNILSGDAGGIAGNVNRWRGQIGLEPVDEATAERSAQPVAFLGSEGNSVELTGTGKAIVVAFRMGPPYSMFLKMDGPTDAVEAHRRAFWEFVHTLKIRKHG